ncbi:MAG: DUF1292 domain-containing protein [Pseudobutyrivibrio sp.]|nr:DUF1292 domain-containing protein [Pseudobutyrivibrio sp.]
MEQIVLSSDDGQDLLVFVLEQTLLGGNEYLLVCEDEEGDSDAFILKKQEEDGLDAVYEIVEDDNEFEAVAKLFEELIGEDADLEY